MGHQAWYGSWTEKNTFRENKAASGAPVDGCTQVGSAVEGGGRGFANYIFTASPIRWQGLFDKDMEFLLVLRGSPPSPGG